MRKSIFNFTPSGLNCWLLCAPNHAPLCVEEHFYLFLPVILILLQASKSFKKSYRILIFLFLFGIVLRVYIWRTSTFLKNRNGINWFIIRPTIVLTDFWLGLRLPGSISSCLKCSCLLAPINQKANLPKLCGIEVDKLALSFMK